MIIKKYTNFNISYRIDYRSPLRNNIDFLSMPFKLRETFVTLKFVNANLLHDA